MAKKRTIEQFDWGKMFGVYVATGFVEGRRIHALFKWTAQDRVGISRSDWREKRGTEEVLKIGSRKMLSAGVA